MKIKVKLNITYSIKALILSFIVIVFGILTNYYLYLNINNKFTFNNLIYLTFIFIIIYLTKNIFTYIREKYLIIVQNNIYSKLNKDYIIKLFYLPYQFFKNKPPGEIISRLNDLNIFREIFSNIILTFSMDILFILVSSIILFKIDYNVFLITVLELL